MTGSRRTAPLPADWPAVRTAVLARDPVCRWGCLHGEEGYCRSDSTEVDHMGTAWDHRAPMLRGICHYHHLRRTSAQANAAQARLRSLRLRPRENHPGYVNTTLVAADDTTLADEGTTQLADTTLVDAADTTLPDSSVYKRGQA